MAPSTRYRGDPRWISVRYPGKCNGCDTALKKGDRAFYFPNGRRLFGEHCCPRAHEESRRFEAAVADEAFAL